MKYAYSRVSSMTWLLQRLHRIHMNACSSDSIPLTLIGVDTRKDSSGGIIKPDTNVLGVHLNTFHWTTHLLYFNNFSYGNKKKNAIKEAQCARQHCFWIKCPKYLQEIRLCSCGWGPNLLSHGGLKRECFQVLTGLVPAFPPPQWSNCEKGASPFLSQPPKGKEVTWMSCELHPGTAWANQLECRGPVKCHWWLNDTHQDENRIICIQYRETLSSKQRLKGRIF